MQPFKSTNGVEAYRNQNNAENDDQYPLDSVGNCSCPESPHHGINSYDQGINKIKPDRIRMTNK